MADYRWLLVSSFASLTDLSHFRIFHYLLITRCSRRSPAYPSTNIEMVAEGSGDKLAFDARVF